MRKEGAAGAQVRKVCTVLTAFSICTCPQSHPAAGSLQAEEMRREDGPCLMLPGLV